ncbi:aminopeptidase N [Flagellatimonas centrodinii]|uniref:aminopeptidase N n=1 Tax=Flagellatimonas centrodinii TaxID=2806210 RepID=UPI001FEF550A|nr:aminopeptidase N [Flagellatimonas centrodinii]ULQ47939.1 aminopeptidase N [Flagellatimonas centrodinii]
MTASPLHRRADYHAPAYRIDRVHLDVNVDTTTRVHARLTVVRDAATASDTPLVLDARGLTLDRIQINGEAVAPEAYRLSDSTLTLNRVPAQFTLDTVCTLQPEANSALEGFYQSGPMYCTQCEAHGFSRITPYLDRPDVLARFSVRLEADATRFPVLLANGNRVDAGALEGGRHYAVWDDPYAKPCYLFAMVAGDLACVADTFAAADGRPRRLEFYVDPGNEGLVEHAMQSLKDAMRWDEDTFGLVYDLDLYMVVAARAFNMGAMENKGLNIFNAAYVLASPETATDDSYHAISAVIAHEYFHNYTGNRVTCRDWFQLSLKEGLTVFRDQRFSEDHHDADCERIDQVRNLRAMQFPEDAGPTAHPVRPDAYQEVNNFYTATVYEKGAEIVRMLHTRIGPAAFREGLRRYLHEHDGTAATLEDFIAALSAESEVDLSPFLAWYAQAGTPRVRLRRHWDAARGVLQLTLQQHTAPTPGQPQKQPLPIPFRLRLHDAGGRAVPLPEHPARLADDLLWFDGETLTLEVPHHVPALPTCLQGFSAPVRLDADYSDHELRRIATRDEEDAFVRWDALQTLQARAHAGLMRDDRAPLTHLLQALQNVAAQPPSPALTARLLAMPPAAVLWDGCDAINPTAFVTALDQQHHAIAEALLGPCSVWAAWAPHQLSRWGERALGNLALSYLARLGTPVVARLASERVQGPNMTLAAGALQALCRDGGAACEAALSLFYSRWCEQPLVLDRWFALQAGRRQATVADVQQLLAHEQFDWGNPNRVRAVLGAFARDNLAAFHTAEGYACYAEALARLDARNPQTAARLSRPLLGFRRLAEPWQTLQRDTVASLRGRVVSTDLMEMLDAALA